MFGCNVIWKCDCGREWQGGNDRAAIRGLEEHIDGLAKRIRSLQAENDKLKSDIRIMIEKAAAKHRPAYEEQQRRIAELEAENRQLRAERRSEFLEKIAK